MGRSARKGIMVDEHLLKKVRKAQAARDLRPIKTWARRSMITPEFVGLTLSIHNGRQHIPVLISENMVGHRLGEFSHTRTFRKHPTGAKTTKR